jgi:hypothetical protein
MTTMPYAITYEAKRDFVGSLVPISAKRQYLVVKYRGGSYAYVCGAFSTMKAAEKRAAALNQQVADSDAAEG